MHTLFGALARFAFWGVLAVSIWSITSDWTFLMSTGGLYAVLGQFFAVFFTLTLIIMLVCLGIAVLLLPLFIYYAVASPDVHEERTLGGWAIHMANPAWKLSWWAAWWLRRVWRSI